MAVLTRNTRKPSNFEGLIPILRRTHGSDLSAEGGFDLDVFGAVSPIPESK